MFLTSILSPKGNAKPPVLFAKKAIDKQGQADKERAAQRGRSRGSSLDDGESPQDRHKYERHRKLLCEQMRMAPLPTELRADNFDNIDEPKAQKIDAS